MLNKQKQILFIYRKNKWDLPKGKIEPNEANDAAALREVSEEIGVDISLLQLHHFIIHSYHIYLDPFKQKWTLKKTHWYAITIDADNVLFHPQAEEDITKVEWIHHTQLNNIYNHSYPLIIHLITSYLSPTMFV